MTTATVLLNSLDKIRKFCKAMDEAEFHAIAYQDNYYVGANSLMGILSLNALKPIDVELADPSEDNIRQFEEIMMELNYEYDKDAKKTGK